MPEVVDHLDVLAGFLRSRHPDYTIADVALSESPGYLETTKPCPKPRHKCYWDSFYLDGGLAKPHYHTIQIHGLLYWFRRRNGQWESSTRFWKELHGLLPVLTHIAVAARQQGHQDDLDAIECMAYTL